MGSFWNTHIINNNFSRGNQREVVTAHVMIEDSLKHLAKSKTGCTPHPATASTETKWGIPTNKPLSATVSTGCRGRSKICITALIHLGWSIVHPFTSITSDAELDSFLPSICFLFVCISFRITHISLTNNHQKHKKSRGDYHDHQVWNWVIDLGHHK